MIIDSIKPFTQNSFSFIKNGFALSPINEQVLRIAMGVFAFLAISYTIAVSIFSHMTRQDSPT